MGIKTKKKFGQHFLKNEAILERIISSHSDRKNVLEIGPGRGALTKYLLPNVKNLLLVEVDNECVKYLNDSYKGGDFKTDNGLLKFGKGNFGWFWPNVEHEVTKT